MVVMESRWRIKELQVEFEVFWRLICADIYLIDEFPLAHVDADISYTPHKLRQAAVVGLFNLFPNKLGGYCHT